MSKHVRYNYQWMQSDLSHTTSHYYCLELTLCYLHQNAGRVFNPKKMLKITISTSVCGAQHPNAGRNIQHMRLTVWTLKKIIDCKLMLLWTNILFKSKYNILWFD